MVESCPFGVSYRQLAPPSCSTRLLPLLYLLGVPSKLPSWDQDSRASAHSLTFVYKETPQTTACSDTLSQAESQITENTTDYYCCYHYYHLRAFSLVQELYISLYLFKSLQEL